MQNQKIQADKITKPIQLLAVWFTGLVLLEGILLTSASIINDPKWLVPTIVISAILMIPLFLYFIFLLQTKYRPQMQEDTFYAKYLDSNTNTYITSQDIQPNLISNQYNLEEFKTHINNSINELKKDIKDSKKIDQQEISKYLDKVQESISKKELEIENSDFKIALNRLLPNSSKVRITLLKEGFNIDEEWEGGSKKAPTKNLISFDRNVTSEFILKITEILYPLGFKYINMIPEKERYSHENTILIGSYAYQTEKRRIIEINEDVIETLKLIKNQKTLIEYFE